MHLNKGVFFFFFLNICTTDLMHNMHVCLTERFHCWICVANDPFYNTSYSENCSNNGTLHKIIWSYFDKAYRQKSILAVSHSKFLQCHLMSSWVDPLFYYIELRLNPYWLMSQKGYLCFQYAQLLCSRQGVLGIGKCTAVVRRIFIFTWLDDICTWVIE